MSKLDNLQIYIKRCDKYICNYQYCDADEEIYNFIMEIAGVYGCEIKDFKSSLNIFGNFVEKGDEPNYYQDIIKVRAKLVNYKDNIELDEEKRKYELEIAKLKQKNINVSANASNETSLKVNIEIEDVMQHINTISTDIISTKDKEVLEEKMLALETMVKNGKTKKAKEKIASVLSFLADKGADALIAVLPYLGQMAAIISAN